MIALEQRSNNNNNNNNDNKNTIILIKKVAFHACQFLSFSKITTESFLTAKKLIVHTIPWLKHPQTKKTKRSARAHASLSSLLTYRLISTGQRYGMLLEELLEKANFGLQPGDFFGFRARYGQRWIETVNFGVETALARGKGHVEQVAVLVEFSHFAQSGAAITWRNVD